MKAYIGYKKVNGRIVMGVTVYDNSNKIIFSNFKTCEDVTKDAGKFANILNTLVWGVRQVKTQAQRGVLSEEEVLFLILDNKTVYSWFENDASIKNYAIQFADLKREINFLVNDVEVMLVDSCSKKVTFKRKGTIEDEGLVKLTDLFN